MREAKSGTYGGQQVSTGYHVGTFGLVKAVNQSLFSQIGIYSHDDNVLAKGGMSSNGPFGAGLHVNSQVFLLAQ
jgi:hypothetical protein